jgi:hypothetical protein
VPPKPIRELRQLTRYRKTQIAERQREANRLHKALEDTGIKLDCVASDILGVSGRAMLDALVSGTTDPVVLADLALMERCLSSGQHQIPALVAGFWSVSGAAGPDWCATRGQTLMRGCAGLATCVRRTGFRRESPAV